MKDSKLIYLVLRIALAGTFIGHGYFAFTQKPSWINYLTTIGFSLEVSLILMKAIGLIDLIVAVLALFKPFRYLFYYALLWTFLTALMRPLTGMPIWDFVERMANWTIPLALLFIQYLQNSKDKK